MNIVWWSVLADICMKIVRESKISQRMIVLLNRNLPTRCHETSLRAFISWIAGMVLSMRWSLTCRMLCAYSIGAPIGAGQIYREKHYHSFHILIGGSYWKIPNQCYTNRKILLWFLRYKCVISWYTTRDHCPIPSIIFMTERCLGWKKGPKSWMCLILFGPSMRVKRNTIHSAFTCQQTPFDCNYPYSFKDLFLRVYIIKTSIF